MVSAASVDYIALSTTISVSLGGGESQSTVVRCVGITIIVNDSLSEVEKNFTVVAANESRVISEITVNIEPSQSGEWVNICSDS